MTTNGRALATRVRWLAAAAMLLANVTGAFVVFVLLLFVMPVPQVGEAGAARVTNAVAFAAYLAFALPLGTWWSLRLHRRTDRWLREGRAPSEQEQRRALRAPLRQVHVTAVLWTLAGAVFFLINLQFTWRLSLTIAITVSLGAAATCAIGYLLFDRILRPVATRALEAHVPERTASPGVVARVLLTWALCSGVPVLGLVLLGGAQLTGVLTASTDRLAATAVFLGGVALVVGLIATVLTARSIADPLKIIRSRLGEVRAGRTDVEVPIFDGSEIGLLQAGFNDMVAGLAEREQLRDLFGRQVGEAVAREALRRGTELGGEVREVAVLFVDVVGSTELAATRPPTEVVELLNEFFCVVVDVVGDHDGAVNKFEGDAALCVFGAPLDAEDPAGCALAAARELRDRVRDEVPHLDLGIGVSAGQAVAGNIGAAERFEYTVIGDPVNEAARLTELAKKRPGRVLASRSALDAASRAEAERWSLDGEETLRGRSDPTGLAVPAQPR